MVRRTLDPANMQAMMQMQAAMQQLQSSGLFPGDAAGASAAALAARRALQVGTATIPRNSIGRTSVYEEAVDTAQRRPPDAAHQRR